VLGKNLDGVAQELKLAGFFYGTRRPGVFIERKLTLADNEVRRVAHRKAIESAAQILHKPPQLLMRKGCESADKRNATAVERAIVVTSVCHGDS
jgi:hypothetical protein